MLLCSTLRKVQLSYVKFDVLDPEHLKAFEMLCLGEPTPVGGIRIKQHPTLRFELEDNFPDVRTMMFHKVGTYHVNAEKDYNSGTEA